MRETSRQAWYEVLPHLSRVRAAVFFAVRCFGPGTAREVCEKADIEGGWKRFSELERLGMIEETDRRRCSVSGRMAIVWGVKAPPERKR